MTQDRLLAGERIARRGTKRVESEEAGAYRHKQGEVYGGARADIQRGAGGGGVGAWSSRDRHRVGDRGRQV